MAKGLKNFIKKTPLYHPLFKMFRNPPIEEEIVIEEETFSIELEYPFNPTYRYGYGKAPHQKLHEIFNRSRAEYEQTLRTFLQFKNTLFKIPVESGSNPSEPFWNNEFFTGLDAVALYSFMILRKPKRYIEVGSGNSTKFARKAIQDNKLHSQIISIDPEPRTEIDAICNKALHETLEDTDLGIFNELEANDILLIDSSHYCFTNSDVTVFFLDVLPELKPGVLVHFHDVYLPYDYPPDWETRYYSEQYLLATLLLAEGNRHKIVLPNAFICSDEELANIFSPQWGNYELEGVYFNGCSFWIEVLPS